MRHVDFLLIGGGLASATAAVTLRKQGASGSIAILAEEDVPPYNRPPLSKSVLLGTLDRQRLFILDADRAQQLGIELLLKCRATSVNADAHIVGATGADDLHYGALSVSSPPWIGSDIHDSAFSSWFIFAFGSPKMFLPRWLSPTLLYDTSPASWTSFYDTSPAKSLLKRYVDFESLGKSPVRLLVTAIDVESGDLEVFDSYSHTLTPDHIVASGSLPPGFPWTTINGHHYWDGGLASNSPLDQVAARCGLTGKRVFIVDLYANKRALPTNIMEVLVRRDELIYAERINRDVRRNELIADFHDLVDEIVALMPPDAAALVKQRPRYAQLMGYMAPYSITRIIREGKGNESPSRDSDFSLKAITANRDEGYQLAKDAIAARHSITRQHSIE
jgi:NTE family protein